VNGKLRDKVTVPVSITEAEAKALALSRERVKAYLADKEAARIIYIPQRLVGLHPYDWTGRVRRIWRGTSLF